MGFFTEGGGRGVFWLQSTTFIILVHMIAPWIDDNGEGDMNQAGVYGHAFLLM